MGKKKNLNGVNNFNHLAFIWISLIFLSLPTPMVVEKHCQADINFQSPENAKHFFPHFVPNGITDKSVPSGPRSRLRIIIVKHYLARCSISQSSPGSTTVPACKWFFNTRPCVLLFPLHLKAKTTQWQIMIMGGLSGNFSEAFLSFPLARLWHRDESRRMN